jgi:antitoxin (DNA-binding transcriptional repressor) of toxin-antitoxin stability system
LYNVRVKRYTSSQVRQRLSAVLDAAERGEEVVIERRGVRFALRAERAGGQRRRRRHSLIEWVDPAVEAGQWTWTWSPHGLKFKSRLKKR